jgi:hypothetical protein
MPRILGEERYRLAIQDPVSGSAITLYFRQPTSEERVAYQLSVFHLDGGERRLRLSETRLKFGLEILMGFEAGDFILQENDDAERLDPDQHPDWKARLAKHAPDLVSYLGQQVFEGLRVLGRGGSEWG